MGERPVVRYPMIMVDRLGVPLWTVWEYRIGDPHAVAVDFGGVVWTFARDLALAGLYGPAGMGDVQVYPSRGRIAVRVASDDGTETVTCRAVDLATFVGRTLFWVPAGAEAARVDVDGAIARVLAETEAA